MTTPGLNTDTPLLVQEAGNFERIAGELRSVLANVEATAASLATQLRSPEAGMAAQAALTRFQEASTQQNSVLDDISQNIHTGGVQYDMADQDGGALLSQQMNL